MRSSNSIKRYFPYEIQILQEIWRQLALDEQAAQLAEQPETPPIRFYRQLADRLNKSSAMETQPVKPGTLALFALLNKIFRYLLHRYFDEQHPRLETTIISACGLNFSSGSLLTVIEHFSELYPCAEVIAGEAASPADFLAADDSRRSRRRRAARELLLLRLTMENPALDSFNVLFDDRNLAESSPYVPVMSALDAALKSAPPCAPFHLPVLELLRVPLKASPGSLAGQLEFIRENWRDLLPPEMIEELLTAFDIVREEERQRWEGAGPPQVLRFGFRPGERDALHEGEYPEFERFSPDRDWMPNVVLIAKMVYVWMDQLTKKFGRPINRLDEIPDEELDALARWGFTGLWLIGIWERSPASRMIKQMCGNPDAIASAYSLFDYCIAADLGGQEALDNLRQRAGQRGIRLASDMVPNHTGIDSRWTREHPDWFIQLDYPPYPAYRFEGPDLSSTAEISLRIEDGYWSRTDAAVVFQHVDNRSGQVRYIYHGNDGTSTPWNDTAQLNYLIPEVREAVIRTILHVARSFPIIRFDAAMTLAKKHYQRLWFPQPGLGGGISSRAEHALSRMRFDELFPVEFWREVVDRVAAEAPDTLLLAEAFWLMEGYFVRTLGMHRVYNSAFMNMLKMEENAKYRQTIRNVLEFNPEILQRFVNFMNNPDERTAIDQFGKEGKYFGAAVLLVTMPGLPMFGHGQIEGFTEKYGMEYRRAYWDEAVDRHLVAVHERTIFPLMKKRWLFSGAENFILYDLVAGNHVDENVFAYSNSCGSERALIVYHNRFASTAGHIRNSCIRTVKDETGTSRQVRTPLAAALAVKTDGRYYYRFRDSITGLEYLRHGRELDDQGLYLELGAYEYCAFLDFREICDDEYGTWGKLCWKLQGKAVADLDDEIRQVRYERIISSVTDLITALPELLPVLYDPTSPAATRKLSEAALAGALERILSALQKEALVQLANDDLITSIVHDMERVSKALASKSRRKGAKAALDSVKAFLAPEKGAERLVLTLHLILSTINSFCKHVQPSCRLTEFGLHRAIEEGFRLPAEPGGMPVDEPALLMGILLTHGDLFLEKPGELRTEQLEKLFADKDVLSYLRVNVSDGIEWFNKERFELLTEFLAMTASIGAIALSSTDKETAWIDEIVRIHADAADIVSAAEIAGYRCDTFLAQTEH